MSEHPGLRRHGSTRLRRPDREGDQGHSGMLSGQRIAAGEKVVMYLRSRQPRRGGFP